VAEMQFIRTVGHIHLDYKRNIDSDRIKYTTNHRTVEIHLEEPCALNTLLKKPIPHYPLPTKRANIF
jgi:hypothetical protein